jgi:hypothetical protein
MSPDPKNRRLTFPCYPLLLAVYPILALLAANVSEVDVPAAFRPLLVSLLLASFLFIALRIIFKDWHKAGITLAFILLLFFSYGHIYNLIKNTMLLGLNIGRHRVLAVVFLMLALGGTWLIVKRFKTNRTFTRVANFITLAMVCFSLIQIGNFHLQTGNTTRLPAIGASQDNNDLVVPDPAPDIYYIILDMYTRSDVLRSDFGYDNSWFIDELENMGFYVADCSRSNYTQTELSLSSSLNMDYLPQLNPGFSPDKTNMDSLTPLLKQSRVRTLLEEAGYQSVAFDTGYFWDSWTDADIYLEPGNQYGLLRDVTPFESLAIQTTAGLILTDTQALVSKSAINSVKNPFGEYVDRQRFILDQMENIATLASPKLVFAHIMIPHYPFIFTADGSLQTDMGFYSEHNTPIDEEHYQEGYVAQVQFINQRTLSFLKRIKEQSKRPVIIIVQGDHGARNENRLAILNAYHFPDGSQDLYANISPVNTFRMILNDYFGTKFDLLPDKSYSSVVSKPFDFTEVAESSQSCIP